MQPFGRNRYGLKIGGLCPFRGGGAGSPPNTMWPGPRPTCKPSFILFRRTVWPQYTNVKDRQTGQTDRQDTQQIDSIARTVSQTVAKNAKNKLQAIKNKFKFMVVKWALHDRRLGKKSTIRCHTRNPVLGICTVIGINATLCCNCVSCEAAYRGQIYARVLSGVTCTVSVSLTEMG